MSNNKEMYTEIFQSFDVDHSGNLSVRELGKCFKTLGLADKSGKKVSSSDLKFLIQCSDKDDDGKMSCDEFCNMATVVTLVSLTELKHLRDVFKSFDLDNNGTISVKEIGKCMEKLGEPMTEEECIQLVQAADKDSDGSVDFFEFVLMIKDEDKDLSEEEQLRQTFNTFDKNGDGTIDKSELREILKTLDENPTEAELEEMFKLADNDCDGVITFEEFCRIVNSEE